MMGIINPSDSLAPTVCNQCKRRKKKCDKVLPTCGRCCKLQILCQYAPEPSEADRDAFAIGTSSCAPGPPFSARSLPVASPFSFISSLLEPPAEPSFLQADVAAVDDLDRHFTQHTLDEITKNGDDIDVVCGRYFKLVEKWMPVVDRNGFFERLGIFRTCPSAAFSTLLLSIYLFTQASTDRLDPRYYTVKVFLSLLQSSGRFSEEVLQAQLLVAMYEFSQSLYEKAIFSIGICARTGVSMGLHKTLDSHLPLGTVSLKDIERKRRIWWCIIIFERVVNASRNGEGKPFACPDPAPHDYFPLDGYELQDIPKDLKERTRASLIVSDILESLPILLNPFTRLAQAVCLLQRVIDHIEDGITPPEQKRENFKAIDNLIQSFIGTLLNEAGKGGDYCGPYSVTLIAMHYLHQHHFMTEGSPPPESEMALETAANMILEGTSISAEYQRIWDTMPFSTLHVVYLTIVGRIKYKYNGCENPSMQEDIKTARNYLKHWDGRWKISSDYLQAIDDLVALHYKLSPNGHNVSYKPEDLENEKLRLERLTISKKSNSSSPSIMFDSLDANETDISLTD